MTKPTRLAKRGPSRKGRRAPRPNGVLVAAALLLGACGAEDAANPPEVEKTDDRVVAALRADSNRDGEVRFDDSDEIRTVWDAANGAVFLANIDDDEERCKKEGDDVAIAKCNDAQDDVVNGEADADDLARVLTKPWPEAPTGTTATVTVEPEAARSYVRVFKRVGPGATEFAALAEGDAFTLEEVQAGIELGIEGTDIVRDASTWDGYVVLKLTVTTPTNEASDEVKLRVAPVLTSHHLQPAEKVWISNTRQPGNAETRLGLRMSCERAGLPSPEEIRDLDPWTQDFFETAYMSMPGKGGGQHVMHVNYRSANVYKPGDKKAPLRPAGKVVFRLRGKDSAGVQQFDTKHDPDMDSLNSFGNYETVPPHEHGGEKYPFGRLLRGKTTAFYPDRSFAKMIEAQLQQPPIDIDTSWLLVGHVDETISFVKAKSPRGWVLLANDARLAKKMLEDEVAAGRGDTPMFVGKTWIDFETEEEKPAETTIAQVLADTEVMKASAEAAVEVDAQVAKLKSEVGLGDDEIIHVPFLHTAYAGHSVAYQPGMVNGIYLADDRFAAPDPYGPIVDGKDVFKVAFERSLAPHGITVEWLEAWEYHVALGEVHCATNTTRRVPDVKWWESGR